MHEIRQSPKLPLRARAAIVRLMPQFPDSPEGRLWATCIALAVTDVSDHRVLKGFRDQEEVHRQKTAQDFLNGPLEYCEMCGVNPSWVKDTLKRLDLL